MSEVQKFLRFIEEIIEPSGLIFPNQYRSSPITITLEENSDPTRPRHITIKGVPEELVALKIDNFHLTGRFVRTDSDRPYGRRCDYLLVDPAYHRLVFVELKLGTRPTPQHEVVNQLKGGRAVADYLAAIMNHFLDAGIDLSNAEAFYLWITFQQAARKRPSPASARDIENPRKISQGPNSTFLYQRITH